MCNFTLDGFYFEVNKMQITKEYFLGIWELKEFILTANEVKSYPFGRNLIGRIMYFNNGQMAVHGIGIKEELKNSPLVWSPRMNDLQHDQTQLILENYFGYFARFEINQENQEVLHHIEGHYIQSYIGQTFIRNYQFFENKLRLYYVENGVLNELIWERMATISDD